MEYHKPVLLQEIIESLQVFEGGKYIDCTLGDGGHSIEILKLGGKVLGLDFNGQSLNRAIERIENEGLSQNFTGALGNFKHIDELAKEHNFEKVNGILYDLGFSSSQLEIDDIGLSFTLDQPLDMRMNKGMGVTAADLVNALSEKELATLFFKFGDERLSRRFAKAIIDFRSLEKIESTGQLAQIISDSAPSGYEKGRIHPATRVFQALRIAVNDEIENLDKSLPRAAELLHAQSKLPGGRMSVITFHSLEDRVVKQFGRSMRPILKEVTKKPVVPSGEEVRKNPRARSAKLRVFEKVSENFEN